MEVTPWLLMLILKKMVFNLKLLILIPLVNPLKLENVLIMLMMLYSKTPLPLKLPLKITLTLLWLPLLTNP